MDGKNSDELRRLRKRYESLKSQRTWHEAAWRELTQLILPRRGRWLPEDTGKATADASKILNPRASLDLRTLAAGLMAGLSSPSRPWFRLATRSVELREVAAVRSWLYAVENRVREILARSNFYRILHASYEELALYGTAVVILDEDDRRGLIARGATAGEYVLAVGEDGEVNTLIREILMTAAQMVERFGLPACSQIVQDAFRQDRPDQAFRVIHVLEPNLMPKYHKGEEHPGPAGMPWRSCYYELSGSDDCHCLKDSGYHEKPFLAPRWHILGGDGYGRGPCHDVLPDVRMLQAMERRKAQAVEKMVNPPLYGHSSLKNEIVTTVPGGINYVSDPTMGLKPIYEVNPRTGELRADMEATEARISEGLYSNLFLMLANSDRRQITAREVDERHEEKMMMLGPVLEGLHDELLKPAIERVFGILMRGGHLPPLPEELAGEDVQIEFISVMAQAQKMGAVSGIERLLGFAGQMMAASPQVADKIDFDQCIDEFAESMGVPPTLVRSDEIVAEIRQQRVAAAQQQQQQAELMQAAQGAKLLADTDTSTSNALTDLLGGRL